MQNTKGQQSQRTFLIKMILAGVKIEAEFNSIDDVVCCKGYLRDFLEADFAVSACTDEIEKRNLVIRRQLCNDFGIILGIEAELIFEKIVDKMIWYDTFLMHGSVVAKDGLAYMFTAPSGIGKTTRTKLWMKEYPDSIIINGDKPFIKVTDTNCLACGSPWCGKEGWNTNIMIPLRAIFILERATNDSIEEISLGKAFPALLQQIHRPDDPVAMRKTLSMLKAMDGKVKIYKFRSTPTSEAIQLAYETARPR